MNTNASENRMSGSLGPRLSISQVICEDGVLTLGMEGRIDYTSASAARAFLVGQYEHASPRRVLVDLEHVTFVDSDGLSVLVTLAKLCGEAKCPLALVRPTQPVLNMIRQTRLDRIFQIEE